MAYGPSLRDPRHRCRANASVMAELETGVSVYTAHDGLQICHAMLLTLVPLIRAQSCPKLTYADTIAVLGKNMYSIFHIHGESMLSWSRACLPC
jgi:hypothetical protein